MDGKIPQSGRPVGAAGGQGVPVRAERYRVDGARGPGKGQSDHRRVGGIGDVPQPDRPVRAAGGQGVPVRAERYRPHRTVGPVRGRPIWVAWEGSDTFHSRILPSVLPAARLYPSGLNATE